MMEFITYNVTLLLVVLGSALLGVTMAFAMLMVIFPFWKIPEIIIRKLYRRLKYAKKIRHDPH